MNLPYIDEALQRTDEADQYPFWRHLHWGLYQDPSTDDDTANAYYAAAQAMTDHLVATAGIADGADVLDVGCGFGGTLDHIRTRHAGCRLVGVNIDERQVGRARHLVGLPGRTGATSATGDADATGGAGGGSGAPVGSAGGESTAGPDGAGGAGGAGGEPYRISFAAADGCRLPVASASMDHVLAVECIFHFPSRRAFFREAARVLRPGGTLTLSDFVAGDGSLPTLVAARLASEAADGDGVARDGGNAVAGNGASAGDAGPAGGRSSAGSGGAGPAGEPTGDGATDGHDAVVAEKMQKLRAPGGGWWGRFARPLTSVGYARLGRGAGFDPVLDEDVTARTLPTYAALHRMQDQAQQRNAELGVADDTGDLSGTDALAELCRSGAIGYHVLSFRRR